MKKCAGWVDWQLSEQNQTDVMEKPDRWNRKARQWNTRARQWNEEARLKNSNRSKERENFWLGPTEWKITGEVRYTLPKWKILRYASEKYYRIHTCKAKTSTIKYTVCWKNNKQAYKILSRNTEKISSLQKYFTVINSKLLNWKYVEKYIERSELGGWVQESEIKYETNFLDGP